MRLLILLASFTIILLITLSCDSATGPEDPPPGRRDYVWTAETLKTGGSGLSLTRLWGSSENDVWAYGQDVSIKLLWHYDGEAWTADSIYRRLLEAGDIIGFSENNVWICSGNDGAIWNYNGQSWNKIYTPDYDDYKLVYLNGIWGRNKYDIYSSGFAQNNDTGDYFGIIIHYDGNVWSGMEIPKIKISYNKIMYDRKSQKYIVAAFALINSILTDKLLVFDGKTLAEFYSEANSYPELFIVDNDLYIVIGLHKKIYTCSNNSLKEFIDFSNTLFGRFMVGRSKNDFFTANVDGLGHYNGNNLETIYKSNDYISNIWVGTNCVFVIFEDNYNGNNIMLKGVLK